MPRPANVTRYVVSGTLPGGESFAWGWWSDSVSADNAAAQVAADYVSSALTTHALSQLKFMIAADCAYSTVTVYGYTAGTGPAAVMGQAAIAAGTGTGTGTSLPLQCGLVISTHTARPGRRGRGRLYLPANAWTLANHQATEAQMDAALTALQDLFDDLNGSTSIPGAVSVVSLVDAASYDVTSVSADSRLDIQRRRAASEAALFDSTQVVTP